MLFADGADGDAEIRAPQAGKNPGSTGLAHGCLIVAAGKLKGRKAGSDALTSGTKRAWKAQAASVTTLFRIQQLRAVLGGLTSLHLTFSISSTSLTHLEHGNLFCAVLLCVFVFLRTEALAMYVCRAYVLLPATAIWSIQFKNAGKETPRPKGAQAPKKRTQHCPRQTERHPFRIQDNHPMPQELPKVMGGWLVGMY